jgi:hypothetical protein
MLNFDEDEALLAIVSVTVFSIVLCDQIESKIAFIGAQSAAPVSSVPEGGLLDQVVEIVRRFPETYGAASVSTGLPSRVAYERLEGALAGYLSAELSGRGVRVSQSVRVDGNFEVDAVAESAGESIAIELKVVKHGVPSVVEQALFRLTKMMESGHFSGGVALILSADARTYDVVEPIPANKKLKLVSANYSSL